MLSTTITHVTWGKLGKNAPKFVIESDATIVASLIFATVLGWQVNNRLLGIVSGQKTRA